MPIDVNFTIRNMNKFKSKRIKFIPKIFYYFNRIIFSCDIMPNPRIHKTVTFPHNALGTVINKNSRIGENSKILQNVTIGGNNGKTRFLESEVIEAPIIGSNVLIGAGSFILGPITIGDNSIIGAGSIVLDDVPPNSVVYGEKSVIKRKNL